MSGHENAEQVSAKRPTRPFLALSKNLPSAPGFQPISKVQGPATSVKTFVENVFIPAHVERKSAAGRAHYHAILKYILTPESVEELFSAQGTQTRARLKSRIDWPYLDNVPLCDLTADHVRQLIACALSGGYSPQTVKHIRNVIGAIIKHAKRERVFNGDNPISDVELPTMTRRERRDLTMEEAKTLLKFMKYPEREVALLTICTGMGVPEICALRWKHVNLTHAVVHEDGRRIPARSIMIGRLTRLDAPGDTRPAPIKYAGISEALAAALIELRQRHLSEDPDDFLLTEPNAGPQSGLTLRSLRLRPIAVELRMPWLSWQVLKRAHQAFLEELRIVLTDELVMSAFSQLPRLDA